MKGLNIKTDTLNLVEGNIGNSPEHTGKKDEFLKRTWIAQELRSIINKTS